MSEPNQPPLNIKDEIIKLQEELKTASKKQEVVLLAKLKELKEKLARMKMKGLLKNALGDFKNSKNKDQKPEN